MSRPVEFAIDDSEHQRLANLCGPLDQNIRQIEEAFDARIQRRGAVFSIDAPAAAGRAAAAALKHFAALAHRALSVDDIQLGLVELQTANTRVRTRPQSATAANAATAATSAPADAADAAADAQPATAPDAIDTPPAGADATVVPADESPVLHTRRTDLQGRTPRQREYLRNILSPRHHVRNRARPAPARPTSPWPARSTRSSATRSSASC